jgi:hypothetical protein
MKGWTDEEQHRGDGTICGRHDGQTFFTNGCGNNDRQKKIDRGLTDGDSAGNTARPVDGQADGRQDVLTDRQTQIDGRHYKASGIRGEVRRWLGTLKQAANNTERLNWTDRLLHRWMHGLGARGVLNLRISNGQFCYIF